MPQIEVRRFVEIVRRLSLLQTERQLSSAIDHFASHSDKSLVSYVDFCQACERAESLSRAVDHEGMGGLGGSSSLRSSASVSVSASGAGGLRQSFVFGSGFDGVASRSRDWGSGADGEYRSGGARGGELSGRPPLGRSGSVRTSLSASQVGSRLWGSETPLELKGRPLELGRGGVWSCSVCMYAENPAGATTCIVCDTADYRHKAPSGSGCRNCRFDKNERGARECAMCGLAL